MGNSTTALRQLALMPGQHGMTVGMVTCPHGTRGLKNTLCLPSSLPELPTAWEGKTFYKCAEKEGQ